MVEAGALAMVIRSRAYTVGRTSAHLPTPPPPINPRKYSPTRPVSDFSSYERSPMPDPAPTDRLLTLRQVGERLNVSVRYVRTLRQSGALPVVRLSPRCLRVRPEDLDRLVAERMAARPPRRARS